MYLNIYLFFRSSQTNINWILEQEEELVEMMYISTFLYIWFNHYPKNQMNDIWKDHSWWETFWINSCAYMITSFINIIIVTYYSLLLLIICIITFFHFSCTQDIPFFSISINFIILLPWKNYNFFTNKYGCRVSYLLLDSSVFFLKFFCKPKEELQEIQNRWELLIFNLRKSW